MMRERKTIEEIASGHAARDASLRRVFLERNIDLTESRTIEFHFWAWGRTGATKLSQALKSRGFEILVERPAAISGDPDRWNVEAAVKQSIDLTMRYEFMNDLVVLADSYGGLYDGWGTRI